LGVLSIFNAIKFIFSLNYDTPASKELQISIRVPTNNEESYVLIGSIVENLPSFNASKPVSCVVMNNYKTEDAKSTELRKIICKNVGQLLKEKKYLVACRLFLAYDLNEASLQTYFSETTIYTLTDD
jgi:hypothetical protein